MNDEQITPVVQKQEKKPTETKAEQATGEKATPIGGSPAGQ